MANVNIAVDFVLKQEDGKMTGEVTTIKGDSGGPTRFGIAQNYHPELISRGFFDASVVSRDAALVIAEQVYNASYAVPLQIAHIDDQAVATAVLSFGINAGTPKAAELLQEACVSSGQVIAVDQRIGTGTITAVNTIEPNSLLAQFTDKVRTFYTNLAESNPQDAGDLNGWLNRAAAWQSNANSLRARAV